MTKTLKISLVAVLMAIPVMAHATTPTGALTLVNSGNTPATSNVVATTSYVQGAYNTLGSKINTVISELAVAADGNVVETNKTVGENLAALDAALSSTATTAALAPEAPENGSLHYVSDAAGTTVGDNLTNLDQQVYANTTDIDTMKAQTIEVATTWTTGTPATTTIPVFPQ